MSRLRFGIYMVMGHHRKNKFEPKSAETDIFRSTEALRIGVIRKMILVFVVTIVTSRQMHPRQKYAIGDPPLRMSRLRFGIYMVIGHHREINYTEDSPTPTSHQK